MGKAVVVNGENSFCVFEERIVLVRGFQVQRNKACDPVIAMNDVGSPAELTNGLDHSLAKEDGTLIVILVEFIFLVVENRFAVKIIFIINKIDLQLGIWNGGPL